MRFDYGAHVFAKVELPLMCAFNRVVGVETDENGHSVAGILTCKQ